MHISTKLSAAFLILLTTFNAAIGDCPDDLTIIQPCTCKDNSMECYNSNVDIDFDLVFSKMSKALKPNQKHLDSIHLGGGKYFVQLGANSFADIVFDKIELWNNISHIDPDAFRNMYNVSTYLDIASLKYDPAHFAIADKFTNLKTLKFTEWQSFKLGAGSFSDNQKHVEDLELDLALSDFGSYTIRHFQNLKYIIFRWSYFNTIHANSFAIDTASNNRFDIMFHQITGLSEHNFEVGSLIGTNRPTTVHFFWDTEYPGGFKTVPEQIFLPFLNENIGNLMDISTEAPRTLDCQDCRSYWIIQHNMTDRFWGLLCLNGNSLIDPGNFVTCKK